MVGTILEVPLIIGLLLSGFGIFIGVGGTIISVANNQPLGEGILPIFIGSIILLLVALPLEVLRYRYFRTSAFRILIGVLGSLV